MISVLVSFWVGDTLMADGKPPSLEHSEAVFINGAELLMLAELLLVLRIYYFFCYVSLQF